jgi:signal peptidase I
VTAGLGSLSSGPARRSDAEGAGRGSGRAPDRSDHRRGRAGWPVLVGAAIVLAFLVKTFAAQVFYIPSDSMQPQLHVDDRVVVSKLSYRLHPPRRGDIVVFEAPPSEQGTPSGGNAVREAARSLGEALGLVQARTELIKRVIALPGETVEGRGGDVYVDGQYLFEPYLPVGVETSSFGPVTVGPGQLWVMGDNRADSRDSRFFGAIPISTVVGRTIWRVWPPGHLSFL